MNEYKKLKIIFLYIILNRERKYDIEGENLEGKYKDWQKKLHPDLVHSKSQVGMMGYPFLSLFISLFLFDLSFYSSCFRGGWGRVVKLNVFLDKLKDFVLIPLIG